MKSRCLLCVLLIVWCGGATQAGIYYIDVTEGHDTGHDGATAEQPWKTLARLQTAGIKPGDTILLRRGCTWRESLLVDFSGTAEQPVVFDAYGDGPLPVISGADEVTGLRETDRIGVWAAAFTAEPRQVFVNGTRAPRKASADERSTEHAWHWADGRLTVFSRERPKVEASVRDSCAHVDGHHITFRSLAFARSSLDNITHAARHGLTLRDCLITGAFVDGLRSGHDGAHDHGLIENCEVSDCGGSGLIFAGRMDGWILRGNHVHHCGRLHEKQVGAHRVPGSSVCWYEWSAGIKYWAGAKVEGYLGSLLIENNLVEGRERRMFLIWHKPVSTYAEWEQAYGGPTQSVTREPDFVNAGAHDYRLAPDFPAVGASIDDRSPARGSTASPAVLR